MYFRDTDTWRTPRSVFYAPPRRKRCNSFRSAVEMERLEFNAQRRQHKTLPKICLSGDEEGGESGHH
jgi:hypothetical protein